MQRARRAQEEKEMFEEEARIAAKDKAAEDKAGSEGTQGKDKAKDKKDDDNDDEKEPKAKRAKVLSHGASPFLLLCFLGSFPPPPPPFFCTVSFCSCFFCSCVW